MEESDFRRLRQDLDNAVQGLYPALAPINMKG